MSKYDAGWGWRKENDTDSFKLTFAETGQIAGQPIDHAFLTDQKEGMGYGYRAGRILMKEQATAFCKRG